jgi:predicted dehydrogenase
MNQHVRIGIVGACGRGGGFTAGCRDAGATLVAVCDINHERLQQVAKGMGASEAYDHFETMLDKSKLDAVILGTPMQFHVPQAIAALNRGISVLSEVPAGVSVDECRDLVKASRGSKGVYMMAENYTYMKSNVIVREMVRRGVFGTPYYGEGEYIHELKGLNEVTVWRRKWQTGVNGVTYGTHSLGPLLQWMPGDRVVEVCGRGSGHHYRDPRGAIYENEESCVMLCKMKSSGLVKIRVDMLSDRPHAMTNYQLQGTDGAYESSRGGLGDINKVWLRSKSHEHKWVDLETLAEEFTPDSWKQLGSKAIKSGHGGGDYFEILDFVNAVTGKCPPPIGIHESMDMTLPGLMSQQSIEQGGTWLQVPDSRTW